MKTNDKKGYDKIYNSIGLVPNLGVGSKGKASSTTQSIISDVILTVDDKENDTKTENTYTERRIKMMELQKRIDILDLWDEMPYSLDIKDFGNTVILVSESCEIRFINCIEVNIKSDLLVKNKSMKFHEYRNHEYDIQDISVEPCVVKTDGTMTHNKKRVSPVLNGVKAKIVMPVMCIDLIAVDFIISTKEDEENLIQSKFSYIDLE